MKAKEYMSRTVVLKAMDVKLMVRKYMEKIKSQNRKYEWHKNIPGRTVITIRVSQVNNLELLILFSGSYKYNLTLNLVSINKRKGID